MKQFLGLQFGSKAILLRKPTTMDFCHHRGNPSTREQILIVDKTDYVLQRIPITIKMETPLTWTHSFAVGFIQSGSQIGIISLSITELNEDESTSYNISGLLQASNDVFWTQQRSILAPLFPTHVVWTMPMGKCWSTVLKMNKQFDGRPQWNDWGGLNDAQRNREFSMGLKANEYTFGDLAGTNNMVMRASQYRKGGRVSYAMANRTYTGRVMASYNSGLTQVVGPIRFWHRVVSVRKVLWKEPFMTPILFFTSVKKAERVP